MGYFKLLYYISYIFNTIRRIFRKNKMLLTFIILGIVIAVFLCRPTSAYADFTSSDSTNLYSCRTYLSTVANRLSYTNDYLSDMALDIDGVNTKMTTVLSNLSSIQTYLSSLDTNSEEVIDLLEESVSLQTQILNILLGTGSNEVEVPSTLMNGYYITSSNVIYPTPSSPRVLYYIPVTQGQEYRLEFETLIPTPSVSGGSFQVIYAYTSSVPVSNGTVTNRDMSINTQNYNSVVKRNFTFTAIQDGFYLVNFSFPDFSSVQPITIKFYTINDETDNGLIGTIDSINSGIDNTNQGINDINSTITDSSISTETEDETDDIMNDSISIFDNAFSSDYHNYNNSFLTTINNAISSLNGSSVQTITLTLPFANEDIVLRGDMISSHIINTYIYTYVQLFWWVGFSIPIFILLRRIIVWLGTGEFINKPSKFAQYMSDFVSNNITPGMM